MGSFHLGLAGRVRSWRLAEQWQHVPEVTLVASRCLAALGLRRGEVIPNCMMAMTVGVPAARGTAPSQLFLPTTCPVEAELGGFPLAMGVVSVVPENCGCW